MNKLLKDFKDNFIQELLDLHWRQWSALGWSTHVSPQRSWWIDVEALILSTLTIGLLDRRMFAAMLEWLSVNGEWVNLSRLRRIKNIFSKTTLSDKRTLLEAGVFEKMVRYINKVEAHPNYQIIEEIVDENYIQLFEQVRRRGIVTHPEIRNTVLLQLFLRAVFGMDAKAESFIYFLYHDSGNSNSIAREIFYDQKNIYRILEKWSQAEIIRKAAGKKRGDYFLSEQDKWLNAFGLIEKPLYLNWVRLFLVLDAIAKALQTIPWVEDIYLLSSLFRDVVGELQAFEKALNFELPKASLYLGEKYFEPFVRTLNVLFSEFKYQDSAGALI